MAPCSIGGLRVRFGELVQVVVAGAQIAREHLAPGVAPGARRHDDLPGAGGLADASLDLLFVEGSVLSDASTKHQLPPQAWRI